MDEKQAYDAGRRAFQKGVNREECPFPAPFNPPRSAEDAADDVRAGLTIGAFWLDGFEQERDQQVPKIRLGIAVDMPLPIGRRY